MKEYSLLQNFDFSVSDEELPLSDSLKFTSIRVLPHEIFQDEDCSNPQKFKEQGRNRQEAYFSEKNFPTKKIQVINRPVIAPAPMAQVNPVTTTPKTGVNTPTPQVLNSYKTTSNYGVNNTTPNITKSQPHKTKLLTSKISSFFKTVIKTIFIAVTFLLKLGFILFISLIFLFLFFVIINTFFNKSESESENIKNEQITSIPIEKTPSNKTVGKINNKNPNKNKSEPFNSKIKEQLESIKGL